jgi:hypothetical protein
MRNAILQGRIPYGQMMTTKQDAVKLEILWKGFAQHNRKETSLVTCEKKST